LAVLWAWPGIPELLWKKGLSVETGKIQQINKSKKPGDQASRQVWF